MPPKYRSAQFMTKQDVISIHLPLNESTQQYVNHAFIESMKKSFWLVNTARGNQVVVEHLVKGTKSQQSKRSLLGCA
jgi:D-3-phosphoglycerate dehydrogenase